MAKQSKDSHVHNFMLVATLAHEEHGERTSKHFVSKTNKKGREKDEKIQETPHRNINAHPKHILTSRRYCQQTFCTSEGKVGSL